jgi:hypothetical protein
MLVGTSLIRVVRDDHLPDARVIRDGKLLMKPTQILWVVAQVERRDGEIPVAEVGTVPLGRCQGAKRGPCPCVDRLVIVLLSAIRKRRVSALSESLCKRTERCIWHWYRD